MVTRKIKLVQVSDTSRQQIVNNNRNSNNKKLSASLTAETLMRTKTPEDDYSLAARYLYPFPTGCDVNKFSRRFLYPPLVEWAKILAYSETLHLSQNVLIVGGIEMNELVVAEEPFSLTTIKRGIWEEWETRVTAAAAWGLLLSIENIKESDSWSCSISAYISQDGLENCDWEGERFWI
ncbi:hypothetical protein AVEN_137627-1 [Araneus ventricosus]|uniref:Uncharacterized protein n=1 Tax=Araneus ventricosus TaxID=182803 RepID=A0A4Y2VZA4_ARAVE|nr:hypothetical protein AVEN_137627-1 [Araneus ventricosus]